MSISKKIEKALNNQVTIEFTAGYIYLSMSAWFQAQNLMGFANWMYVQYQEELTHGMRIFNHIIARGGKVSLQAVAKPKDEWGNPVLAFEESLKLEVGNTKNINNLYELAQKEKDNATMSMLKWFIDEQVEEEENVNAILDKLKIAGNSKSALLMLDKELESRKFTDETQEEE